MMTRDEIKPEAWADMLHPIFARCVDPDIVRYDLSRPFVIDEYVYATNARIAVRMPTPEWWLIPDPEKLPAPRLVVGLFVGGLWRPEPTQFPPVEGACETCKGEKVLPEMVCPWCHGESPGPYEAGFCDECWELEGRIPAGPCHGCGGTGLLDAFGRIEVAPGYWLQRRFVAMLHEFEMTTYLPEDTAALWRPTRFTLGDITGVVMSMTPPGTDGG